MAALSAHRGDFGLGEFRAKLFGIGEVNCQEGMRVQARIGRYLPG